MNNEYEEYFQMAAELKPIPFDAVSEYRNCMEDMINNVNLKLSALENIEKIIGGNPLQIMYDNHKHHCAFMATVFCTGSYKLLATIIPWVYKAYSSHGFSYEYFEIELNCWIRTIDKYLKLDNKKYIVDVYRWMIRFHQYSINLSKDYNLDELPVVQTDWLAVKNKFLEKLLEGNTSACTEIAKDIIDSNEKCENFYLQVIHPVMFEVGFLWERGQISVAVEHMASAIVTKILAYVYSQMQLKPPSKGKILITAAPNEFHEIGAWMFSDIIEADGWLVKYLGSNTPENELFSMLRDFMPDILAISVTMPFNIPAVSEIISNLKNDEILKDIKVIVGGKIFLNDPTLVERIKADACALNPVQAKKVILKLKENNH